MPPGGMGLARQVSAAEEHVAEKVAVRCCRRGEFAEAPALAELFQRSCPLGEHRLADCDGVLIDIH